MKSGSSPDTAQKSPHSFNIQSIKNKKMKKNYFYFIAILHIPDGGKQEYKSLEYKTLVAVLDAIEMLDDDNTLFDIKIFKNTGFESTLVKELKSTKGGFKTTIHIREGQVEYINGCMSLYSLADEFMKTIDQKWPTKRQDCHQLINALTETENNCYLSSVFCFGQKPATRALTEKLISEVNLLYILFLTQLVIPAVLEDGKYSIENGVLTK